MTNKKLTFKDWVMIPILLLVAAIDVPLRWLWRKLQGKSFSSVRLLLNESEMHALERASHDQSPVFLNGKDCLLKPFTAKEQHIHASCGSCPDELHLDDIHGQACLVATRGIGSAVWRVAAMKPVVWGLFGYRDGDLKSLRVGDEFVGKMDNDI